MKLARILLRIGLAIVFLYAAIGSFTNPLAWEGYLPNFAVNIVPAATLLMIFSVYEVLLAVWLLIGKKSFYAAVLAAITLAAIVIVNPWALDVTFRDIGLFFAALALAALGVS